MKYILIIYSLLITIVVQSQDIVSKHFNLKWTYNQVVQSDGNSTQRMPLVNDNLPDYQLMIPTFVSKWSTSSTEITTFNLSNVSYEPISKKELLDIEIMNIPTEITASLNVVVTRGKKELVLQLTPLIRQRNQLKKIISFTLNYASKLKSQVRRDALQIQNSVLSQGDWYKFSIDTTGIYKLSHSFLRDLGLSLNNINPKNIAIYGNGGQLLPYRIGDFRYDDLQENAIYVAGEEDGSFDSDDYILFYAKGPDNWTHANTITSVKHQKNIYSDKAFYFVHIKPDFGKRIVNTPSITTTPGIIYSNFDDYAVHELELTNLFQAGQQWLGESFAIENVQTVPIHFQDLDVSEPITITTRAVASSSVSTSLSVGLNSQSLYTLIIPAATNHNLAKSQIQTTITNSSSDDLLIELNYNNGGNPASECYLDYIEVIGKKKLIVRNKQFSFRNFSMINATSPIAFNLENPENIKFVWDVTNLINPKNITNQASDNSFYFVADAGELHEYIVVNSQDYYTPDKVGKIQNQNLHELQNVDYLIVTKDFLIDDAEILATYHREHNNLNVKVVPLYQIYNEFGSGAPDITAIRDFVKYLYDHSQPHLQYVLLFGDASFDFKGIRYDQGIVPAFESYNSFNMATSFVTDDYYVIVEGDNEGDLDTYSLSSQDVAIARIPVNNERESADLVQKLLSYYNTESFGDWRNQVTIIADDIDASFDEQLQIDQELLADNIKANKPLINLKKIYADAFPQVISSGGSRYPEVNAAFTSSIERGTLVADYFGHGGEDGLALERILETYEIEDWTNADALSLLIVVSCEFARFDNPLRPNTAGELAIRNTHGGSGHLIATAREITISTGNTVNRKIMPLLLEYNGENNSISENLRLIKNEIFSAQRFFVFSFGDPAMRLAIPKPDIKLTHMNGVPVTQDLDTIRALSHIYFDGIVTQENGIIDTNFNGELSVIIYDKPSDKETLLNDGVGSVMVFDTQESKIFRGRATVTNGIFSFDFVAPRDIRIAYGNGKLSFYADNDLIDKGGYNTDIVVGGINEEAPEDNQGPKVRLYMNDESFIDGGTTNQSPLFLAFLEDENGINTSLTAVDHDIVATLDNDQTNQIILNEYYTTELNDFTKGSLEYRLQNLTVGPHVIHLKAYDTYNNPAEATLNFIVLDDGELVLDHVLNYPNPFVNYTEFWFNHNKPNEALEVQIQIFTVSGKLVKTINRLVQNTGGLSREIHWNGLDDFGQRVGKGVYVYKLEVTAQESGLMAKKYEKLVILQ